jgi:hypothetical protein
LIWWGQKNGQGYFGDFQGTLAHNDWMFSKALYKVLINNDNITDAFSYIGIQGLIIG